ncbi:MAG: 50S ribosomal protein L7/L12 [Calditrichaeota bacterium]|jgi:large subunit ribosomal protein L7/L12|nr:50S ribosomal protein L7/L12 [Calditrichota bacterium]MBT7787368.1 50S ribosomal protein L7/L12 [Calditrichota bacterium]
MLRAAKPAAIKIETADNLETLLRDASSILMADFSGMPVSDFDSMRRKCFENKIAFKVLKNRIAKIVLEKLGHTVPDELLTGPTGFCIGFDDPIVPVRIIADYAKEKKRPIIKGCFLEGELYGPEKVNQLKSIPPREILLGSVIGAIVSPLSGFVFTLNEILRSFVGIVDALSEKMKENNIENEGLSATGGSVENVIEAIEKMTVLELVELKKALEDKFGVTAAAPMAMAGMMPGADAGAAVEEEEQTEFAAILTAVGDKKIQVIKEVRAITGLGLKEAKALVDESPKPIKEDIPKDEAMAIKDKIEAVGGQVDIK